MGRIIRLLRENLQWCRNDLQEDLIEEDAMVEVIYATQSKNYPIGMIVIFDKHKFIDRDGPEIFAEQMEHVVWSLL